MSILKPTYFILAPVFALCVPAWGQMKELERLSGFAQHQKENAQYDKAREKGERAYLEEADQWDRQQERERIEYKKTKKIVKPLSEDSPEARADAAAKEKYEEGLEIAREKYVAAKRKEKVLVRETYGLPTEAEELGLTEHRPRYDYRKRATFGAKPKYGSNASSGSGSGSFNRGGGDYNPGPSFPPPPVFDDGGYVPAPNLPEDFGDIPPPPPPPPPPPFYGEDDYGGYNPDFPPPPPPPPPSFGDDGEF